MDIRDAGTILKPGHPGEPAVTDESWDAADPATLGALVLQRCLAYAGDSLEDPRRDPLYAAFTRRVPADERLAVLARLRAALARGVAPAEALLPFIVAEPVLEIVAAASLALGTLYADAQDPLAGPRSLRRLAEETADQDTRLGILAGLLALGDRPATPALRGCWRLLDHEHQAGLARAPLPHVHPVAVELYCDWAEEALDRDDSGMLATAAAGLRNLAGVAADRGVREVERRPPPGDPAGRPVPTVVARWSREGYGRILGSRLRALAAREAEAGALTAAMDAWGLGPASAPEDTEAAPPVAGAASSAPGRSYAGLALLLFAAYMAVAVGLYVWRGVLFRPDRWAMLLFVGAVLLGQWKSFLRDWTPMVFLLFGYEFMRGLAFQSVEAAHRTIHLTELIAADRAMFGGQIPVLWLQQRLFVQGTVHWYDVVSVVVYAMFFIVPLLFAFLLWIGMKERFWQFTFALLAMTYVAFVIYLLYPAAPPWMANEWGAIHGVQLPFNQVWDVLIPHPYNNLDQVTIWNAVAGNPVAAMPSLHAAYPWLTLLFAVKYFGKKGLAFVPYNLAVWFSVVYLGQHWVIDIVAGVLLASLAFVLMLRVWPRVQQAAALTSRRLSRVSLAFGRGPARVLARLRRAPH